MGSQTKSLTKSPPPPLITEGTERLKYFSVFSHALSANGGVRGCLPCFFAGSPVSFDESVRETGASFLRLYLSHQIQTLEQRGRKPAFRPGFSPWANEPKQLINAFLF